MSDAASIVPLESYATVIAALGAGLSMPRALALAEVAPPAWEPSAEHWQSQIQESAASDLAVLLAFDAALLAAQRRFEPAVTPIESDIRAWAHFRRHFVTAAQPVEFLAGHALTLGTYARIEADWTSRALSDEALAATLQRHMQEPLEPCPGVTLTPSPLLRGSEAPPEAEDDAESRIDTDRRPTWPRAAPIASPVTIIEPQAESPSLGTAPNGSSGTRGSRSISVQAPPPPPTLPPATAPPITLPSIVTPDAGPPAPVLPFVPSAPPAQPPVEARQEGLMAQIQQISLAQYANICAALRACPEREAEIRAYYGMGIEAWSALHALWRDRLSQDPSLRGRFQILMEAAPSAQRWV